LQIKKAEFVQSAPTYDKCPEALIPEFAFIGRSNVGKSSLINYLVNRKGLALTSSNPGKTQTINHFIIDDSWHIVDLPGYGYAKVSQKMRFQWELNLRDYLLKRGQLMVVFVLVDANIPPQKSDLEMISWLGENNVPLGIIFTKVDRSKVNELKKNQEAFHIELKKTWKEFPNMFLTSAEKKHGGDELLDFIEENIKLFKSQMEEFGEVKLKNPKIK